MAFGKVRVLDPPGTIHDGVIGHWVTDDAEQLTVVRQVCGVPRGFTLTEDHHSEAHQ